MNSWYGLTPNEKNGSIKPPQPFPVQRIVPGSMCYLVVDDAVLLIQRNNPPHVGLWSAPGGKMNPGETPEETVLREVYEESGLRVIEPSLRAVVTVLHAGMGMQWLLFVYHATHATGQLHASDEGEIGWVGLDEINQFPRPAADVHIFNHVVSSAPVTQFKYTYDQAENLVDTVMG